MQNFYTTFVFFRNLDIIYKILKLVFWYILNFDKIKRLKRIGDVGCDQSIQKIVHAI